MSKFGWDLPPGAAGHPDAPWNQPDPEEECWAAMTACYPQVDYEKLVCNEDDLKANPGFSMCPLKENGYCTGDDPVSKGGSKGVHPKWQVFLDQMAEEDRVQAEQMAKDYQEMQKDHVG